MSAIALLQVTFNTFQILYKNRQGIAKIYHFIPLFKIWTSKTGK